jgi:GntR family transcriptional regulator
MIPLLIDERSTVPPSRQIVEAILDGVAAGDFRSGERLPSVRDLAVQVMLNPNTIGKAYRELIILGAAQSRSGSGVFVADDAVRIARERRRKTTLSDFRRAAGHALRAGHSAGSLRQIVERLAAGRAEPSVNGGRS